MACLRIVFVRCTALGVLLLALFSCGDSTSSAGAAGQGVKPYAIPSTNQQRPEVVMAKLAERFVRLSLALGVHDGDYVDAYHGPKEWREAAVREPLPLVDIIKTAERVSNELQTIPKQSGIDGMRQRFLSKQLSSLAARARIVAGERLSFDDESRALYDAAAPVHEQMYFENLLTELDSVLPGSGDLPTRVTSFRNDFTIKPELLDIVFKEAIKECRRRTLERIELPENESFTVEYVTGKAWSGYNWFQGNARSLIQVNTEFPISIDRAIDLACHEGYPGHHVYNTLLEKNLFRERGWTEFSVFPLFSPTGLIAEGSANYGIDMAFIPEERYAFEETVLFPLAQLDATRVREYYGVEKLLGKLKYAGNYTARRYLDGEINAEQAADELVRFALMPLEKAQQRIKFVDKYRSYVINYNLGRDIVADWIEKGAEPGAAGADLRWQRFEQLLSQPMLPSELIR